MVKSELLQAINEKLPKHSTDQVESAVNCLLKQIEKALVKGEHIGFQFKPGQFSKTMGYE